MRSKEGIAIAGTHGKTTTTSLVASLLAEGGKDPTFVIGGLLNSAGTNARMGTSQYFVAEADESDASFLYLKPKITIVTNIDADHLWAYHEDFHQLQETFIKFLHHLPLNGLAIVCIDDPKIREVLPQIGRPLLTYGAADDADLRLVNFRQQHTKSYFTVEFAKEKTKLDITLNLPGKHNALNALAAIAVAKFAGVTDEAICKGLLEFKGIGRRFQIRGEYDFGAGKVTVIDDYGHHPREIDATILAAKAAWPGKRLVLAFQPHRYTRTKALFEDFAQSLSNVDKLLLLDVYPAGEKPIAGADGRTLCRAIRERGQVEPVFISRDEKLKNILSNVLEDGDILLMQGAGDVGAMAAELAN